MYEYKYVTIKAKGVLTTEYEEHREVIDRAAREGWRYVGWVPTCIIGHGTVTLMDLVFEREA